MIQRIFLIDDSEGEAMLVKQLLRDAGFSEPVYWVPDSREAMRYLIGDEHFADRARHPLPDIILLDLSMPGMDGYEFLRWLRGQPEISKIFVVALTGEMDPKRIQLAYQLGANSYLSKNAGMEEYRNFVSFLQTMSRVVNNVPGAAMPTVPPKMEAFPDSDRLRNSASNAASG